MRVRRSHSRTESIAAWAVVVALSFTACAKAIVDPNEVPGGGAGMGDGGVGTQANGADASGAIIGTPTGAADANVGSTGDDSGSTSTGDDSGSTSTPETGTGGQDSAAPPLTVCPDTSTYSNEYLNLNLFTLTNCTTNSDCSSKDCCYAGTAVVGLVGPACVKK